MNRIFFAYDIMWLIIIGALVVVVLLVLAYWLLSSPTVESEQKMIPIVKKGPATIRFVGDNRTTIFFNNQLYQDYPDSLYAEQTLILPEVKSGDHIGFLVENTGGPGGLKAAIEWMGTTYLTEDNRWQIEGGGVGVKTPPAWVSVWDSAGIAVVSPSAQWIWDSKNTEVGKFKFLWVAK